MALAIGLVNKPVWARVMLRLPSILCRAGEIRLPMSELSAGLLVETLLEDGSQLGHDALSEALALDPSLTLWVLCQAQQRHAIELRSTFQAASWLILNARAVFCDSPSTHLRPEESADGASQRTFAELAVEGVQLAELAAQLAGSERQNIRDETYVAALVHGWPKWSRMAGANDPDDLKPHVSPWILRILSEVEPEGGDSELRSRRFVVQALAIYRAKGPSTRQKAVGRVPDRHRAAEIRGRWIAKVPGAGHQLSRLTARLARLETLEQRFTETLENEKLAAMAELAAGAGHEINPPLTIISGRVQLFLQDEKDPERRRALAAINRQALRVHEMIADMMLFARPESPQLETVDLVKLVNSIVGELEPVAVERQIKLIHLDDEPALQVLADPVQLGVAVKVLATNALEAVAPGGRVEITTGRKSRTSEPTVGSTAERKEDPRSKVVPPSPENGSDGDVAEIRVCDDGPGIPDDVRRHIFEPFYSGRAAGRGLGFGLPKCWRIVTNHGGQIEVDSRTGRGASFRVTLPVAGPRGASAGSSS